MSFPMSNYYTKEDFLQHSTTLDIMDLGNKGKLGNNK